jgi:hypothetical protein
MDSIKSYLKESQLDVPTEQVEFKSFDEWIDSLKLEDDYIFESWEFYDNPRNIKQNPEQKRDEQGRLIEYKEDSEKLISWGELKEEMKNLYDEKENVYELGLKYGYPYMSGGETVYLGNSSKYKFQMTPNGNVELKSQSTGNLGRWDNYKKVGDNGWTKEMYRRTYDSISSGKLD